jgi:hypothetical protein
MVAESTLSGWAPTSVSVLQGADMLPGADPLVGVERVLEVRDTLASAPTHRVVVRMEGTGAPVERVRVELVEQALRGELDVKDPTLATRLRGDAGALLRTLEGRGYEGPSLTVGGAAVLAGAGDANGDLLAAVTRGDGLPHALRALLGETAPSPGRGAQDPGAGGQRSRDGRHESQPHDTRRDTRRDSR